MSSFISTRLKEADKKFTYSTQGKIALVFSLAGLMALEPLADLIGPAAGELATLAVSDSPVSVGRRSRNNMWLFFAFLPVFGLLVLFTPLYKRTGDAFAYALLLTELLILIVGAAMTLL